MLCAEQDQEASLVSIVGEEKLNLGSKFTKNTSMPGHEAYKDDSISTVNDESGNDESLSPSLIREQQQQQQELQVDQKPLHHQQHQQTKGIDDMNSSRDGQSFPSNSNNDSHDQLSVTTVDSEDSESSVEIDSPSCTSDKALELVPETSVSVQSAPPISREPDDSNNKRLNLNGNKESTGLSQTKINRPNESSFYNFNSLPMEVVHLSHRNRQSFSHSGTLNGGSSASCASSISSSSHSLRSNSRRKKSRRRASRRPASSRMVDNFFNHGASFISQNSGSSGNDNSPRIPPRRLSNGKGGDDNDNDDETQTNQHAGVPQLARTKPDESSCLRPSLRRHLSSVSCGSSTKSGKSASSRKSVRFQTPLPEETAEPLSKSRRDRYRDHKNKKSSKSRKSSRANKKKSSRSADLQGSSVLGSNAENEESKITEDLLIFDNSGFDPSMSASDLSSCSSSSGSYDSDGSDTNDFLLGGGEDDGNESDDLAQQLARLDAQIAIDIGRKSWTTY